MVKKFLTIMCASVMAMLAFTAYSNDDEPQGPSGEKMLENIDKIIVDQADAGNLYQKKDDAARFILVADSKEAAHGVCEKFILDQWDVKQRTVKLPDNCGRISLTPGSDESIFYTVSFNALKNFKEPDMTVVIVPEEYMDGDNLAIDQYFPARWTEKCPNCGHKWKTFASGPYTCSECGHKFD